MSFYCHKIGHEIQTCYELVGYPKAGSNSSRPTLGGRNSSGRGRGPAKTNVVATVPSAVASSSSSPATLFTAYQWKALVGLPGIAQLPPKRLNSMFDFNSWIIDIGVTHHVTSDQSWFSDMVDIDPCLVSLPNGESVVAIKKGFVSLSPTITLSNVLLVPQFGCNLLSIS